MYLFWFNQFLLQTSILAKPDKLIDIKLKQILL